MTRDEAINTLIALAICDRPIFSCDECPACEREPHDCNFPTDEKAKQAIRALQGIEQNETY